MIHGTWRAKAHVGVALLAIGCGSGSGERSTSMGAECGGSSLCDTDALHSEYNPGTEGELSQLPSDHTNVPVGSEVCAAEVISASLAPVNLFLMVDRSGSMATNGKWKLATGALRTFLQDPRAEGLRVGLRFFSDDEPMVGCTMQGCSIDACAEPLVDFGTLAPTSGGGDAHETLLLGALERTFPRSGLGTPIYPALGGALQRAGIYQSEHPTEKTVVVLVTDGEPNGCNQDIHDISALAADAHAAFGVLTYAIGLEGSNEAQMDAIAGAGRTRTGIFIRSSGSAEQELLQALNAIRGQTMSCDFELPVVREEAGIADVDEVNITLQAKEAQTPLYRVESEAACSAEGAAWYYDDPSAPRRIHLCPSACELASRQGRSLNLEVGCVATRRAPTAAR